MWSTIFNALVASGGFLVWKAFKNKDADTWPACVDQGTPVREWPKAERRKNSDYQIARFWRQFLAIGLAVLAIGLGGAVWGIIDAANSSTESNPPTRDELIDALAADPENSYDRAEAECIVDFFDETGIDFGSTTEDEIPGEVVAATQSMSAAEVDILDSCLDEESRDRASRLTDAQIREIFIEAMISDPVAPIERHQAECVLDVLEDRGVTRDLLDLEQRMTTRLEAALLASDKICT